MVTRQQKLTGILRMGLSAALFTGLGIVLLPVTGFTAAPQPVSTYTGHKDVYDNCIDICPDYESQYKVEDDCKQCHGKTKKEIEEMLLLMDCTRP